MTANPSEALRAPGRETVARALLRYLDDHPTAGTFRTLIDYLGLGYAEAQVDGWLDFNNRLVNLLDPEPAAARADERRRVEALDVRLLTTAIHVADPIVVGGAHNPMCEVRAERIAAAYAAEYALLADAPPDPQ